MRIYFVKKARATAKPRRCRRGGEDILAGEPYRYITPRFGGKVCFCQKHPPRQSDLAGGKLSEVYAVQEGLEDDLASFQEGKLEDLDSSIQMAAEEAQRIGEEYEESASNMPDSLQDSPVAEECRERAEACSAWADELEGISLPEEPDEYKEEEGEEAEEPEPCPKHGVTNEDDCDPCGEYWAKLEAQAEREQAKEDAQQEAEEERQQWIDECVGEVEAVLSGLQI